MTTMGASSGRRRALAALSLTLGLLLAVGLAEITLRLLAREEPSGYRIRWVLVPWTWEEWVARTRAGRDQPRDAPHFLLPDPVLGWAPGPGRSGQDEPQDPPVTYHSSREGIRSPVAGLDYRALARGRRVVALLGDSFAFSLQVDFAGSIGGRLQDQLGDHWLVLNFGVNGYGVDQTWLRYREQARTWRPEVVLFGLSNHDLVRSLAVYPFVSFGGGWLPYAKPRFVLEGGELRLVNAPLIGPGEILERSGFTDLPFIELDYGYRRQAMAGRPGGGPLLWRWWQARSPATPEPPPEVSDDTLLALNTALIRAAHDLGREDGSRTVSVLYPFPGSGDFGPAGPADTFARQALGASGQPWYDLTPCLAPIPRERFHAADGIHYSPEANAAAAACLARLIRAL